ncbi:MAG: hypothetical protein ACKVOH_06350 [Chlamydiales bacterium]
MYRKSQDVLVMADSAERLRISRLHPQAPGCCSFAAGICALALGILLALSGIFAYLAITGNLPPNAVSALNKFSVIGMKNAYLMMGGGVVLTALGVVAFVCTLRWYEKARAAAAAAD